MATYSLTVNGVERELLMEGYDIHASLDGPDTLAGSFLSDDATFRPALGDEIVFTVDGARKFAGFVLSTRERGADGPGGDGGNGIVTEITAEDYGGQARRRYITLTVTAGQTIKQALTAILGATSLEAVSLAAGQANGPALTQDLVFVNERVADALDVVIGWAIRLDAVGWYWRINYDGDLQAFEPDSVAAPFDLIEGQGSECGDVEVEDSRSENFANKVIVDGGSLIVDNHVEVLPVGDGVTTTFQLEYIPLQWWVVTRYDGVETLYETIGTSPALWTIDPVAKTITRVAGPPGVGDTLSIAFKGRLDIVGEATSGSAAASPPTDVWEKRVSVNGLTSIAEANAYAQALVDSLSASNKLAHYPTDRSGLVPGQTQTITSAKRNLSGSWLVRDVQTTYHGAAGTDGLRHQVTASAGKIVKDTFQQTYREWIEGEGHADTVATVEANEPGGCGWDGFDHTAGVALKDGADGAIFARRKIGGLTFGVENAEAILAVLQKNENVLGFVLGNSVAGASKAFTIWVANDGTVYVQHQGSTSGLNISEGTGPFNLSAGRNFSFTPGDSGVSYHSLFTGLNALHGLALGSQRLTGTSITIDSGIGSGGTVSGVYVFDPTANATVTLPALTAHHANPSTSLYRVLYLRNDSAQYVVTLDGDSSDLIFRGATGRLTFPLMPGASVLLAARTGTGAGWKVLAYDLPPLEKTFTDAQVKALPTNASGLDLAPAPGSGFYTRWTEVELITKFASGAYVNVNTTYSDLNVATASGGLYNIGPVNDTATTPNLTQMEFWRAAASRRLRITPFLESVAYPGGEDYVIAALADGTIGFNDVSLIDNLALKLWANNNGSGDYTGGHSSNTLLARTHYSVEVLP